MAAGISNLRRVMKVKKTLSSEVSKLQQEHALHKLLCAGGCITGSILSLVGLLSSQTHSDPLRSLGRILFGVCGCWGNHNVWSEDRTTKAMLQVDPSEAYDGENQLDTRWVIRILRMTIPFVLPVLDVPIYALSMVMSVPIEDLSGECSSKVYAAATGIWILEWIEVLAALLVIGVSVHAALEYYSIYQGEMDSELVRYILKSVAKLKTRIDEVEEKLDNENDRCYIRKYVSGEKD